MVTSEAGENVTCRGHMSAMHRDACPICNPAKPEVAQQVKPTTEQLCELRREWNPFEPRNQSNHYKKLAQAAGVIGDPWAYELENAK